MLITFIRHGLTEGRPYVFRGRSDPGLSNDGWRQLESSAGAWEAPRIGWLYSSPRRRCETFAQRWAASSQIPCTTLSALAEIDFGAWEELSPAEARARDPDCFEAMTADLTNWSAPDGESYRDFRARVLRGLDDISQTPAEHVGVLTHGGVIRVVLCEILGMPAERAQRIAIDCGSTCRVWYSNARDARLLSVHANLVADR